MSIVTAPSKSSPSSLSAAIVEARAAVPDGLPAGRLARHVGRRRVTVEQELDRLRLEGIVERLEPARHGRGGWNARPWRLISSGRPKDALASLMATEDDRSSILAGLGLLTASCALVALIIVAAFLEARAATTGRNR